MEIKGKYVDSETGEVLGYLYKDGIYSLAVTLEKARELNLDDSKLLPYLELEEIPVRSHKGLLYKEEDGEEDEEFDGMTLESKSRYCIGGMWFSKYTGLQLDNEVAIRRFSTQEDL